LLAKINLYNIFSNKLSDKAKFRFLLSVKVLISLGLLYFLNAKFKEISFTNLFAFQDLSFFIIAVCLLPLNFFLQYFKWKLICDNSFEKQKNSDIFLSLLTGLTTGILTPGRLGEYPGRVFPLKNVKLSEVTAGSAIDKFNSLLVILIAGSFGAVLFLNRFYFVENNLTISLFILLVGVYSFILFLILSPEFWHDFIAVQISRFKIIEKYFLNFKSIGLFNRTIFGKNFAVSILNYIVFSSQFILLVCAYSTKVNPLEVLWGSSLVFFTKSIIPGITFGEIGIRESASIFFLGHFGIDAGTAFNAAITLYMMNVLMPAIPGAVFIFRRNK
jgi:uncharacterized membrane protein YbhN (UPF0104 family)